MKIVSNSGSDRVIDLIRSQLQAGNRLGCVTPTFSLFAFAELRKALAGLEQVQLLLPPDNGKLEFLGGPGDHASRNRLQTRWLANQCAKWMRWRSGRSTLIPTQGSGPRATPGAAEES